MPPDPTQPTETEVVTPSPETAPIEPTPEPTPPSETSTPDMPHEAPEAPTPAVDMPPVNSESSVVVSSGVVSSEMAEERVAPPTSEAAGQGAQPAEQHVRSAELSTPSLDARSQPSNIISNLLQKAKLAIQNRKTKKLEKILVTLDKKNKISNDEVQKLLNVFDATATRYLSILEQQGKIKQTGKTGKYTFYTKI